MHALKLNCQDRERMKSYNKGMGSAFNLWTIGKITKKLKIKTRSKDKCARSREGPQSCTSTSTSSFVRFFPRSDSDPNLDIPPIIIL
jgi:hypothetical protein